MCSYVDDNKDTDFIVVPVFDQNLVPLGDEKKMGPKPLRLKIAKKVFFGFRVFAKTSQRSDFFGRSEAKTGFSGPVGWLRNPARSQGDFLGTSPDQK